MTSNRYDDAPQQKVVETASATTSPDNARSGHFAHVIAVITIALLALIGTGLSGCISFMTDIFEDEFYGYDSSPYSQLLDDQHYEHDYEDYINEYLDDLVNEDGTDGYGDKDNTPLGEGGVTSVKDVLGSDLGIYHSTIDKLLPASVYANAQGEVRTFVRELVLADRDASSQMATELKAAAWSEKSAAQAIEDASQQAQDMVRTLQGMALPKVEGERSQAISRNLEIGRGKAIDRWKAIADELDLLSASDEVDARAASDADDLVTQAAQEAADAFSQALSDSATF